MIYFGGNVYYIDLDKFEDLIQVTPSKDTITDISVKSYLDEDNKAHSHERLETTRERSPEVSSVKYDLLRSLLEIIMDDVDEDNDDTLGVDNVLEKRPLSYRIAFNTLIKCGVLIEEE